MEITDEQILNEIWMSIQEANEQGENWADNLPGYVHCEDKHSDDPWYIGSLEDGRSIWLTREDLKGWRQFSIRPANH